MPPRVDLSGSTIGNWLIGEFVGFRSHNAYWRCRCSLCGCEREVSGESMRHGASASCGCRTRGGIGDRTRRHGMSGSLIYGVWQAMVRRCHNPNTDSFQSYGGRGILVCDRWRTFEGFIADMGMPPAGMTLDRIDCDKGYSKDNCRWASWTTQQRNRRNNRILAMDGKSATMAEWAQVTGLSESAIRVRVDRLGWDVRRALTQPSRTWRRKVLP